MLLTHWLVGPTHAASGRGPRGRHDLRGSPAIGFRRLDVARVLLATRDDDQYELLVLLEDVRTDSKPRSAVRRNNQGEFDGAPWKEQLRELCCYVLPACFAELLTRRSLDMPDLWTAASPVAVRQQFAASFILQADVPGQASNGKCSREPRPRLSLGARAFPSFG